MDTKALLGCFVTAPLPPRCHLASNQVHNSFSEPVSSKKDNENRQMGLRLNHARHAQPQLGHTTSTVDKLAVFALVWGVPGHVVGGPWLLGAPATSFETKKMSNVYFSQSKSVERVHF